MSSLYIDGTFRISQEILKLRHIKVKSRADARLFTVIDAILCRSSNISWEMRKALSIYREDIRAFLYIFGFELIMFRILVREM